MTGVPVWLPIDAVIDFQAELIDTFGGAHGVRDRSMLESALARPQNKLGYGETDMFRLAAAYGYGLCRNHCFVDGNKRIAFAAMVAFLELNGRYLDAREGDAFDITMGLAAGHVDEASLAEWLRANSVRLDPPA